jgi:hypothetical protein
MANKPFSSKEIPPLMYLLMAYLKTLSVNLTVVPNGRMINKFERMWKEVA